MTDRNYGTQSNKKVDIYLRFKNAKDNGMGMPLPAGRIRVSKQDPADKTLEFIGEDAIDHTPKDEKLLIKLGSAFDVVGERRQVDFKVDTARNWMEETIEIKLRNHKNEPVKVIVKENLFRWVNWEITKKTHKLREDRRPHHRVPRHAQAGRGSGDHVHGAVHVVDLAAVHAGVSSLQRRPRPSCPASAPVTRRRRRRS